MQPMENPTMHTAPQMTTTLPPHKTYGTPPPYTGGSNKQSKLSMTSTREGDLKGTTIKGGLGWPVPTARCFHPSTRPIPDNFPFQQSKRKTSTSYIQTERESPPALAPSTNDTPPPNNIPMMMMDSDSFQTRARRSRCPKIIAKQTKDRKKRTSKHALSRKEDVSSLYLPKTTRHSQGKRI